MRERERERAFRIGLEGRAQNKANANGGGRTGDRAPRSVAWHGARGGREDVPVRRYWQDILLLLSVLERAPEREKDDRGWGARCCDALAAGADKIAGESDWYPLQLYSYIFNCLESKKFETNCKKTQTSPSINIST